MEVKALESLSAQGIFGTSARSGHEQVIFCHDAETGLKAIIAIHNTVLAPALGATRMFPGCAAASSPVPRTISCTMK